jgi:Protein of unknown function (DUF3352)
MAKNTAIAAAALLTASAAGAGGYYYLQNRDPGDRPEQLAQAVPEQAYAVGYIATDPKVWSKLDRFGNPASRQLIERSIQQLQTDAIGDINYQKDVQPWLGNIMFASFMVEQKAGGAKSEKPALLVVSRVKNQVSAFNFMNKLKGKSKDPATETEYKGAKVFSVSGKTPFHVAYLDDWLVSADDLSTVQKSIDTLKGAPSFSQKNGNQFFASGRLNLPNPIASVYIDFPRMGKALATSDTKIDTTQFNKLQSFVAGMGLDDQGVRAKALSQMNDNSFKLPKATGNVLTHFPADTILVMNGTGIKNIWEETVKQSASDPKTQSAIEDLRKSFRAQTNLDLDKDVFGWLVGEYAIGLFPQKEGLLGGTVGIGMTAVIENGEKQASEKSLDSMVKGLVAGKAAITPHQSKDGKNTINDIVVSSFGGGPVLSYGGLDDKSVFISTREMTMTEPLNKGADFQKVVSAIPGSDQRFIYVNFKQLATFLETGPIKNSGVNIPADYLNMLKSIEGLAIGGKADGNTYQSEGILMLTPATK